MKLKDFWCQKVLPLVYDDSLSYYEVLCKLASALTKTNEEIDDVKEYVDNWTAFSEIKFADPIDWSIEKGYLRNTIVLGLDGNSYLSKKDVPRGIALDNSEYWYKINNFNASIIQVQNELSALDNKVDTNVENLGTRIDNNYTSLFDTMVSTKVKNFKNRILIAHRGSSYAPENTMEAFATAYQLGYEGIESDLNYTSDGVLVMLHDNTVNRTSNGTGNIREMTYLQASSYNYNVGHSDYYSQGTLPTLEAFVGFCKTYGLICEIDIGNRTLPNSVLDSAISIVKRLNYVENTIFACDTDNYSYITSHLPNVNISVYCGSISQADAINNALSDTVTNYVISSEVANVYNHCLDNGYPTKIWTINSSETINSLFNRGANEVLTDSAYAGKIVNAPTFKIYDDRITASSSVKCYNLGNGNLLFNFSFTANKSLSSSSSTSMLYMRNPLPDTVSSYGLCLDRNNNKTYAVEVSPSGNVNIRHNGEFTQGHQYAGFFVLSYAANGNTNLIKM